MELLTAFILSWLLAIIAMSLLNSSNSAASQEPKPPPPPPCDQIGHPHEWSYNQNGDLQCVACGYLAGE